MKPVVILLISILAISASAQIQELQGITGKVSGGSKATKRQKVDINSALEVIHLDPGENYKPPVYCINGRYSAETIAHAIDPQQIDSITIDKQALSIAGKEYYGRLNIKTKAAYDPGLISLHDLKNKYLAKITNSSIILIDNKLVTSDHSTSLVDEKYILKIELQRLENEAENLNVTVIRLVTKTPENISKANEIRIRGFDTAAMDRTLQNQF